MNMTSVPMMPSLTSRLNAPLRQHKQAYATFGDKSLLNRGGLLEVGKEYVALNTIPIWVKPTLSGASVEPDFSKETHQFIKVNNRYTVQSINQEQRCYVISFKDNDQRDKEAWLPFYQSQVPIRTQDASGQV